MNGISDLLMYDILMRDLSRLNVICLIIKVWHIIFGQLLGTTIGGEYLVHCNGYSTIFDN